MSSKKNDKKKEEIVNPYAGNIFDRVFRQNSPKMVSWVERRYEYQVKKHVFLKEKIAKTLEREIDFLCKLTTRTGHEFLLHMEFQSADNDEMIYRMREYHALISRKYKLPVRQIVIYLGAAKSKMITQLPEDDIFTGFELISINEIEANELLNDQVPEIIIMALLGNYDEEHIEKILRSTIDKLKKIVTDEDKFKRYINQLFILSRLRNLEKPFTKILKDMPITFEVDVEKDYLYKIGFEKGSLKKEEEFKEVIQEKEEEFKEVIQEKEEEFLRKEEEVFRKSIIGLFKAGIDVKTTAKTLNITQKKVKQIIKEWKNKK